MAFLEDFPISQSHESQFQAGFRWCDLGEKTLRNSPRKKKQLLILRSYLGGLLWLATPTKLGWFLWFGRGSIPMNLFWITSYVPVHVSCHWCTGQGPPPWWSTELLPCRDLCFAHLRQEHGTRWRSILDTANGRVMESKARFLRQLSLAELWPHAVEDSLGFAVFIGFSMVPIIIIGANVISHAPSSCATSSSICGSLLGITSITGTNVQHMLPTHFASSACADSWHFLTTMFWIPGCSYGFPIALLFTGGRPAGATFDAIGSIIHKPCVAMPAYLICLICCVIAQKSDLPWMISKHVQYTLIIYRV